MERTPGKRKLPPSPAPVPSEGCLVCGAIAPQICDVCSGKRPILIASPRAKVAKWQDPADAFQLAMNMARSARGQTPKKQTPKKGPEKPVGEAAMALPAALPWPPKAQMPRVVTLPLDAAAQLLEPADGKLQNWIVNRPHSFPPGLYIVAGMSTAGATVPAELRGAIANLPTAKELRTDYGRKVLGFIFVDRVLRKVSLDALGEDDKQRLVQEYDLDLPLGLKWATGPFCGLVRKAWAIPAAQRIRALGGTGGTWALPSDVAKLVVALVPAEAAEAVALDDDEDEVQGENEDEAETADLRRSVGLFLADVKQTVPSEAAWWRKLIGKADSDGGEGGGAPVLPDGVGQAKEPAKKLKFYADGGVVQDFRQAYGDLLPQLELYAAVELGTELEEQEEAWKKILVTRGQRVRCSTWLGKRLTGLLQGEFCVLDSYRIEHADWDLAAALAAEKRMHALKLGADAYKLELPADGWVVDAELTGAKVVNAWYPVATRGELRTLPEQPPKDGLHASALRAARLAPPLPVPGARVPVDGDSQVYVRCIAGVRCVMGREQEVQADGTLSGQAEGALCVYLIFFSR